MSAVASSSTSYGPIKWTGAPSPWAGWHGVAWSPELHLFVAVGQGLWGGPRLMTSSDGITWTGNSHTPSGYSWSSVAWSPQLGLFVAVAYYAEPYVTRPGHSVMTSRDGVTWTLGNTPADATWWHVVWAAELGLFVAVANNGSPGREVMTSTDGFTWTLRSTPESGWAGIAWSPQLGLLVAVAEYGTYNVMTSPDAVSWTGAVMPGSGSRPYMTDVAWSPQLKLFVAPSWIGKTFTSPNGFDWAAHDGPAGSFMGIAWSPEAGLFVAVPQGGQPWSSPDGVTWTLNGPPWVTSGSWWAITWSPQLRRFVALGFYGAAMYGEPIPTGDFGSAYAFTFGLDPNGAYSRDPVNLATGSFTAHADDLTMPGRVIPFAFSRWYNSADPTTGPLGPGWTHSYNWKLTDNGTTVEVRRGDGRRDPFTRNGDGTYTDPPSVFDTLVRIADGTFALTLTSQVTYSFSAAGQLTRIAEPAGNAVSLTYGGGSLTAITDTVGRNITLAYNAAGQLASITDPLGRKVSYGYEAAKRLVTVTDKIGNGAGSASAHQWKYAYDGTSSHIVTVTDPDGRVRVTNIYDDQGRVTKQRDGVGAPTTISYGKSQTVVTDSRGNATTSTFDGRMRVLDQTDTVGGTTYTIAYTYDASGDRTSVTDRNGARTDFTYGTRGNVLTKTDPAPSAGAPRPVTRFAYNAKSDLTQVTDPLGFGTAMTYDPTTNVLLSVSRQIDASISAVTSYAYTDVTNPGLPTRITSPRGSVTSLTYDAQGDLIRRVDADGATTTFNHDRVGRLVSFVDPDGNATGAYPAAHTWAIRYDENDEETARTEPLGGTISYGYDGAGDRISVTDRNGNITAYDYDANTRLRMVRQQPNPFGPTTYTTEVARDANGNATRITQANAAVTDYAFDALDRLTSVTTHPSPTSSLTTSYALDGNGQPTSRTTGDGTTVNYAYDALGLLTAVSGPSLSFGYSYDLAGRRASMTDATGTTTYSYDGLGRVTRIGAPNGALSYAYDLDGDRTRLTYPDGRSVAYAYSPGGRLTTVTDWSGRVSRYEYTPSALVSRLVYPNGLVAAYGYDDAQRLTDLAYARSARSLERPFFAQHFTLDAEGDRTALDETTRMKLAGEGPDVGARAEDAEDDAPAGVVEHFSMSYDGLERLTALTATARGHGAPSLDETFTYDAATNLAARTGPDAKYTVDGANRLTSDGTRSFVWDGADRLIQRGSDAFVYDSLGRLVNAKVPPAAGPGSERAQRSFSASYGYDGDGLLQSRTATGTGEAHARGNDDDGSVATSFVWDTSQTPAPLLSAGSDRVVQGLGPLYLTRGNDRTITLVRDGLGSVRAETNSEGAVTKAFRYAAYGALEQQLPANAAPTLLGFTGELADATGLVYLRQRWYDPGSAHFLTKDRLPGRAATPISLNGYAYAHADPIANVDPSGLICVGVSAGGSASIGTGSVGAAGTVSFGLTLCGGGSKGLNLGIMTTVGAFAGGRDAPGAIGDKTGNVASGAYAGGGFGAVFSPNATEVSDFGKEFRSETVDLGIGPVNGSVNYSSGSNSKGGAIDVLTVSPPVASEGLGGSYTLMTTWTFTQELWSQRSPK